MSWCRWKSIHLLVWAAWQKCVKPTGAEIRRAQLLAYKQGWGDRLRHYPFIPSPLEGLPHFQWYGQPRVQPKTCLSPHGATSGWTYLLQLDPVPQILSGHMGGKKLLARDGQWVAIRNEWRLWVVLSSGYEPRMWLFSHTETMVSLT